MYESKRTPGKKFGSIFAGKKYDEDHTEDGMHSESPEHEVKETPEFEAGEHEGAVESKNENEGEDKNEEEHPVMAEHGKAHKVVIHHDHEAGRHTVTSHHKDGHSHTNVHPTDHEAHKEARKLAGVPADGQAEEHESPMAQKGKPQAGAASEEDGFAMPDLM